MAEPRARNYWAKHAARFGSNPAYLAVATSTVMPSEVQDVYSKLTNSETTASFFGQGGSESELQLLGITIYDTKAGRFVNSQGYVSVDTPPLGSVARFGPYIARHIGWG